MTDNKLKIRIQIPSTSQPDDAPQQSTDIAKKQGNSDKAPFDMQKISIMIFVIFLSIGSFVYLVFIDETKPTPTIAEQNTISNDSVVVADEPISTVLVEPVQHLSESLVVEEDELINVTSQSIESEPIDVPYVAAEQNIPEPPQPIVEIVEDIEPHAGAMASLITPVPGDQSPVIQAQLTSAIHQREPVDEIDHIELNQGASVRIHFFMRLRDLAEQQVSVHWFYQNNEVAKLALPIGNNEEWRTHANKLLPKTRLGQWHVELHDAAGNLLAKRNFTVSNNP